MRLPMTLSEFATRHGVHRAHIARTLGIEDVDLHLLDCGRAVVPDSDVPLLARRIGSNCELALRRLLAELSKVPAPYDFVLRIGGCSTEWKDQRSATSDPARFLDERFPNPIERLQVAGPNTAGNFEWRRVTGRIKPQVPA